MIFLKPCLVSPAAGQFEFILPKEIGKSDDRFTVEKDIGEITNRISIMQRYTVLWK